MCSLLEAWGKAQIQDNINTFCLTLCTFTHRETFHTPIIVLHCADGTISTATLPQGLAAGSESIPVDQRGLIFHYYF